jgi:hypothetical protein
MIANLACADYNDFHPGNSLFFRYAVKFPAGNGKAPGQTGMAPCRGIVFNGNGHGLSGSHYHHKDFPPCDRGIYKIALQHHIMLG